MLTTMQDTAALEEPGWISRIHAGRPWNKYWEISQEHQSKYKIEAQVCTTHFGCALNKKRSTEVTPDNACNRGDRAGSTFPRLFEQYKAGT